MAEIAYEVPKNNEVGSRKFPGKAVRLLKEEAADIDKTNEAQDENGGADDESNNNSEAVAATNKVGTITSSAEMSTSGGEALSWNFSQIRKRFEEKCKLEQKGQKGNRNKKIVVTPMTPVANHHHQENSNHKNPNETLDESKKISELSAEFKRLHPSFKDSFTRRQFATIETYFHMADKNQDGYLEPKEVKELMTECKQSINLCDADIIVSIGDHDLDGKLSPKEFLELCKPSAEMVREEQCHHMEGCFLLPSNLEFAKVILQKLRNFVTPVSSRVKGTRQFFENFTGNGGKSGRSKKTLNLKQKSTRHVQQQNNPEEQENLGVKTIVQNFEAASQTCLPIQYHK